MKKFIGLGLILGAIMLTGCGSEAPGAYDTPTDTKPTSSTAFKISELQEKEIYMVKGSTTLLIKFYTTKYTMSTLNGLTLESDSFSINSDGSLQLGSKIYQRTALVSSTKWSVTESYDSNGDGAYEMTDTTWYVDAYLPLSFSTSELNGLPIYIINSDGRVQRRNFTETTVSTSSISDNLVGSLLVDYSVNSDGSLTIGETLYTRTAMDTTSWSVQLNYDSTGDGIKDTITMETWHTSAPTTGIAFTSSELNATNIYILDINYNYLYAFGSDSYTTTTYDALTGETQISGTYTPYSINTSGSIYTQNGDTYTRVAVNGTAWTMLYNNNTTQYFTWYTQKPDSF